MKSPSIEVGDVGTSKSRSFSWQRALSNSSPLEEVSVQIQPVKLKLFVSLPVRYDL